MPLVEGEDSESEEEIYTGSQPPIREGLDLSVGPPSGTATAEVVEGEATESEEEDVSEEQPSPTVDSVQPLVKSTRRPEFDTPLHKKLREKNTYLRRAVHQLVTGAYNRSSQGLAVCADHLSKLQGFGQETLDTVSDANDALEKMKEQLDIVTAESILPLFKKPLTGLRMQTADTETDSSI